MSDLNMRHSSSQTGETRLKHEQIQHVSYTLNAAVASHGTHSDSHRSLWPNKLEGMSNNNNSLCESHSRKHPHIKQVLRVLCIVCVIGQAVPINSTRAWAACELGLWE